MRNVILWLFNRFRHQYQSRWAIELDSINVENHITFWMETLQDCSKEEIGHAMKEINAGRTDHTDYPPNATQFLICCRKSRRDLSDYSNKPHLIAITERPSKEIVSKHIAALREAQQRGARDKHAAAVSVLDKSDIKSAGM